MPLLFFSGGIDSTTLAFDLAQHPYRYGVSVGEGTELTLVTVAKRGKAGKEREKQLFPLVHALRKVATYPVRWVLKDDGLEEDPTGPMETGGHQLLDAINGEFDADMRTSHYTAGWILWMAAVAVNLLHFSDDDQAYNPHQVFLGQQYNGPVWKAIDAGMEQHFDTMPQFYVALNETIRKSGENVLVRCPFHENRMNRAMIIQLGWSVGVPFEKTSSCMMGWRKQCGACAQCMLRQAAFRTLGMDYT